MSLGGGTGGGLLRVAVTLVTVAANAGCGGRSTLATGENGGAGGEENLVATSVEGMGGSDATSVSIATVASSAGGNGAIGTTDGMVTAGTGGNGDEVDRGLVGCHYTMPESCPDALPHCAWASLGSGTGMSGYYGYPQDFCTVSCERDADCEGGLVETTATPECRSFDNEGRVCVWTCTDDMDCPEGTVCSESRCAYERCWCSRAECDAHPECEPSDRLGE